MSRRGAQAAAAANMLSRKNNGFRALRMSLWKIAHGAKAEQKQQKCQESRELWKKKFWKIAHGAKAEQKQQKCHESREIWKKRFVRLLPAEQGQSGSKINMSSVLVHAGFADLLIKTVANLFSAFRKKEPKEGVKDLLTTLSGDDKKEAMERVKAIGLLLKSLQSQVTKMNEKLGTIDQKLDRLLAGSSPLPSRSPPPPSTVITSRLPSPVDPQKSAEDEDNGGNGGGE